MVVEEIGDVLVVVVGCEDNKHKVPTKNSIVGGSCHKYDFCRDKHAKTRLLSRQKYACRYFFLFYFFKLYKHVLYLSPNNSFVATNIILSRQKFCRNKHIFVATKDLFCRDKAFVATKIVLAAVPANDRTGSLCGNMYH